MQSANTYVYRKKGGGSGMVALTIAALFGAAALLLIGPTAWGWTGLPRLICTGFGLLILIFDAFLLLFTKLYVKTSANEAFFRTGQGAPRVVIDGGCIVVPVFHELIPVLLETMKLEVVRQGTDALICKDFLRVDVSAEFFVRVNKTPGGVKAAATTLGHDATNPSAIKARLMEKLVSALRTVAATMELNELHQNREDFGIAVQQAVTKDIDPNGLILETVTISQLDQTDVKNLKTENVFDAQGLRKASEITQKQLVIKNQIERQAELAITQENVATRKKVLDQEKDRSFAEADQKAEVANRQAEKEREIAEFDIAQKEQVEKRAVQKDREVRAVEIQREAALVEEQQKRETAEVRKTQAVDVAGREKQIAVAEAEARRAEAEAAQRLAEAKEREAAEKVTTAAEVEISNREKQKAVIHAEQEGETQLIDRQKKADAEAYARTRQAQAEKEAAENQASARIRLAEADLESRRREAEGQREVQMVPVHVDAERVKIEQQRVEVLRQELEAKDTHEQSAIYLEVAKLQIEAGKEVGVSMARSIGEFMSKGSFQIFGDPTTVSNMTGKFAEGLGVTQILSGLKNGNPLVGGVIQAGLDAASAGLEAVKVKAKEAAATPSAMSGDGEKKNS